LMGKDFSGVPKRSAWYNRNTGRKQPVGILGSLLRQTSRGGRGNEARSLSSLTEARKETD